ncbi:MAG: class II aldolase/adducin family protein [Clostridia bacterium]
MSKIIDSIKEYVSLLKEEGLCAETGDMVAVKCTDGYYRTSSTASFKEILDKDIIKVTNENSGDDIVANIFNARGDINIIMITHPQSICTVAKSGATIYAVLDDMAQIVGRNAKVVPNVQSSIISGLKRRNSTLIKDEGCITLGRTLNEAFTNCMVLEKAAKVFICTSVIGKGKKIGFIDAKLMHFVYKIKYSKKNQEQLAQEEM